MKKEERPPPTKKVPRTLLSGGSWFGEKRTALTFLSSWQNYAFFLNQPSFELNICFFNIIAKGKMSNKVENDVKTAAQVADEHKKEEERKKREAAAEREQIKKQAEAIA